MNADLQQLLVDDLLLDPGRLHPDASLEGAGLDSLGIVELSVMLSDRWGVQIPEQELAKAETLEALDHLVNQRIVERATP